MDFRRTRWIQVALVAALAIGVPMTAAAQAPPAAGQGAHKVAARAARGLRPAHRVVVVAVTRTPVRPTHPQQEPRT